MNRFKPKILRYESLPSTNTELARLASQGAEEGVSVVADEQTAGRGRLQRTWVSPKGAGLYLSVLLRPTMPFDKWPLITLMTALAVHEAVFEACGMKSDIKWPNDLLAGERKFCGILAEAVETNKERVVVVGIGINLTQAAFPRELAEGATSVAEITGNEPDRDVLLSVLLATLDHWYSLLQEPDGPRSVLAAWANRSSYVSGKHVSVSTGDEVFEGVTRGVESDGALRVETETEGIKIVRAGDILSVRPSR